MPREGREPITTTLERIRAELAEVRERLTLHERVLLEMRAALNRILDLLES